MKKFISIPKVDPETMNLDDLNLDLQPPENEEKIISRLRAQLFSVRSLDRLIFDSHYADNPVLQDLDAWIGFIEQILTFYQYCAYKNEIEVLIEFLERFNRIVSKYFEKIHQFLIKVNGTSKTCGFFDSKGRVEEFPDDLIIGIPLVFDVLHLVEDQWASTLEKLSTITVDRDEGDNYEQLDVVLRLLQNGKTLKGEHFAQHLLKGLLCHAKLQPKKSRLSPSDCSIKSVEVGKFIFLMYNELWNSVAEPKGYFNSTQKIQIIFKHLQALKNYLVFLLCDNNLSDEKDIIQEYMNKNWGEFRKSLWEITKRV